jgi:chromosome segregation ATPase
MKKALSSIGSLFFKISEEEQTAPIQQQSQTQQPVQSPIQPSQSIVGQEDKEIKQQLLDALEKANMPGYDYFEFIKAIDAQMSIIPSEAMRFQSTFAVASTMGVNVETLLSSAQHYLGILTEKEKEFLTAMDKHAVDAVGGKEGQIQSIDSEMQKKAQQIQQLTQDINELQQQKTVLTNEISTNKIKIDTVKNNFFATLKTITDRIKNDVEKIKQYLTQTAAGGK